MKKGTDLRIAPVTKLTNKEGTPELQLLTRELNDVLYRYRYRWISKECASRIQKELTEICTKIKDLKVPLKAQAKKNEILTLCRIKWKTLKDYINEFTPTEEDKVQAQKTVNYLVLQLVEAKKDRSIYKDVRKWMEECSEVYTDYVCPFKDRIKTDKLESFTKELDKIYDSKLRPWSGF